MQDTPWLRLLGHKARRVILAGGLCLSGWGCHHHHYYYNGTPTSSSVAGCPPGTTAVLPSTVTSGQVCDVNGDEPIITSSPSRSTSVSDGRKSRVVVSEPSGGKSAFGWRASDPEATPAITQTQVEGGLNDSSVRK